LPRAVSFQKYQRIEKKKDGPPSDKVLGLNTVNRSVQAERNTITAQTSTTDKTLEKEKQARGADEKKTNNRGEEQGRVTMIVMNLTGYDGKITLKKA